MKKILTILFSILVIISGCSSEEPVEKQDFNPRVSPSEIYTFNGFYEGFDLSYEEQQLVRNGVIHISQSYLIPTQEYTLAEYPLNGTQALNPYLENNREEIKEFMVKKYEEQAFGWLTINVRDDRVFDYQLISSQTKEYQKGILTFRYEVVGQEDKLNYYEDFYINEEILAVKDENDKFDENIFYPDADNDGEWYAPSFIRIAADNKLSRDLAKYYSKDVEAINDYINSTGRYEELDGKVECNVYNTCQAVENVQLTIDTGEFSHELELYFLENNMTIEEIINHIEKNNYNISLSISPHINKKIYDEYDFEEYYGENRSEYEGKQWDYAMGDIIDDYSDSFIKDKNALKNIIEDSSMTVSGVMFNVSIGYTLPSDDLYGMYNVSVLPVRYDYDKHVKLDEDLDFVEFADGTKHGSFFSWSNDLVDNDE